MKEETTEWIRKAEEDYSVAEILLDNKKKITYDAICFHSQQCAEKYLKSILFEHSIEFPYTHDLKYLARLLKDLCPWLQTYNASVKILTDYGSAFRYPGEEADLEEARNAFRLCTEIRQRCIEQLSDTPSTFL
jgi:HEPN domain-containing protein